MKCDPSSTVLLGTARRGVSRTQWGRWVGFVVHTMISPVPNLGHAWTLAHTADREQRSVSAPVTFPVLTDPLEKLTHIRDHHAKFRFLFLGSCLLRAARRVRNTPPRQRFVCDLGVFGAQQENNPSPDDRLKFLSRPFVCPLCVVQSRENPSRSDGIPQTCTLCCVAWLNI